MMNETLLTYGLPGIVIAGLSWFVMYLMKRQEKKDEAHRNERNEWQETIKDQFKEQNHLTKENTNILSGLKTLLENRK